MSQNPGSSLSIPCDNDAALLQQQPGMPRILNEACHEIPRQYLDSSKARRLLDWEPLYRFDEALDQTIAWYAEFLNRAPQAGGFKPHSSVACAC